MVWKMAEAKQKMSQLVQEAQHEPQLIYKRDHFIVAVIDAREFTEYKKWKQAQTQTLADRFQSLRKIAEEENYFLMVPKRKNRENPFGDQDVSL